MEIEARGVKHLPSTGLGAGLPAPASEQVFCVGGLARARGGVAHRWGGYRGGFFLAPSEFAVCLPGLWRDIPEPLLLPSQGLASRGSPAVPSTLLLG